MYLARHPFHAIFYIKHRKFVYFWQMCTSHLSIMH
jgi:hypothetical protein